MVLSVPHLDIYSQCLSDCKIGIYFQWPPDDLEINDLLYLDITFKSAIVFKRMA